MIQSRISAIVSAVVVTVVLLMSCSSRANAKDAASGTLAGKTVEQYASELADDDRTVRLRAAKSLTAMGDAAATSLKQALDHDDPAVRYIAAAGLGRIGGKALEDAHQPLEKLVNDQRSQAVSMAASFALCRSGKTSKHLSVLVGALTNPERGIVCAAAELLGDIGPSAGDAVATLKSVHAKNKAGVKGGDYHIGGAAMNALRKIDPENFK